MAPTVLLEYTKAKELKKKNTPDLSFTMMGKSQKFSQGYSSAVVPECRHAAETMGESEGFGSSGRVDSEDSCAPKRKCIRLNADKYGGLNVPLQVISLSKISDLERKELEVRLRAELEQVQTLQKRISLRTLTSISGAAVSSSSNGQGKKCDHFGQNGTQLKRGITGRFESTKQAQPRPSVSSSDVMLMKQCAQLLKRLMSHQYGWVFNTPVDTVKLKIPDYYTVIKHPMDLGTIKAKIGSGGYSNPWDFVADVRLTFTNAMTYNSPGNDVHFMADVMSKFFETRWKPMEKKLAATDSHVKGETEANKTVPQSKKRKIPPVNHSTDHSTVLPERVKPKMTAEEKQILSRRLEPLLTDPPEHIINFLRRHGDNAIHVDEDEMEIGIDFLSDDTLLELRRLLDDYVREKQTGQQAKADPCEMEILNESGLSNSSMHPCKGNEPAEEDVDIGGNDPPISSYPPVEIEKDTAPKSSKCSSSSSSSSDSGSSSSDSDSGSSSGSESGDRVTSPAKTAKGSVAHEAALDQEKSDIMNPLDINRTVDELDEPEHDARHKPVFIETDGCQEGENAPSERQVSPDKLYRAALLRSRFADTILKAREKTLDQREKRDPEKQRREREELERQQREEKARLQAEAKAAEEARRRAEAEAAAEAKRKRELEREAARQALLKMEKTVEMSNSLILKDLEMLRTVPVEHGPSFVDEASPDYSPDGLGGFKLGGSNPLEQLGLYMKVDDEDEEEAEPSSAPADDVEEGEID